MYASEGDDESDPMVFQDAPVRRSVFLVGDSERIEEVLSSSCRSVSTIPNMLRP